MVPPVMPIAELVRVWRSCDGSWHSPLGDAAATAWGVPSPVFVRSSANHVFVARPLVLRMRPGAPDAVPGWATRLAEVGAPVAAARRSVGGRLVERVQWEGTTYSASAYDCVDGGTRAADTGADDVRRWGEALATLHATTAVADGLPSWRDDRLTAAVRALTAVREVAETAAEVLAAVTALPGGAATFGPLHGDPELDNVVWSSEGPVFVDLDDAARGWFVGDVAFALREVSAVAAAPDLAHPVAAAFLEGYRSRRPLTDEELTWLPLMARAHAVVQLARLQPVLSAAPDPRWPAWAGALDARVRKRADQLVGALQTGRVGR